MSLNSPFSPVGPSQNGSQPAVSAKTSATQTSPIGAADAQARRRDFIISQLAHLRDTYSACSRDALVVQTKLLERELRELQPDA